MTDIPIRERLARALANTYWLRRFPYLDGDLTQEQWIDANWQTEAFTDDVDAILAELQEPSEGMVEIGLAEIPLDVHERADLPRAWKWMILHIRDGGS